MDHINIVIDYNERYILIIILIIYNITKTEKLYQKSFLFLFSLEIHNNCLRIRNDPLPVISPISPISLLLPQPEHNFPERTCWVGKIFNANEFLGDKRDTWGAAGLKDEGRWMWMSW